MTLSGNIARTLSENLAAAAVEFEEHWYTRGDLRALCDAINAILDNANVGKGRRIGVVVRNDPAHLAAMFAALISRRCLVFISPFQEPERLAAELTSLNLPVIIASTQDWSQPVLNAARKAGSLGLRLSSQDMLSVAIIDGLAASNPVNDISVDHAIELLTSGTSGVPKRVPFSYTTLDQAILHQVQFGEDMGETTQCVLIQYPPMASISGAWNAFLMGYQGRRLIMLEKFAVREWRRAVTLYRPRFVALPPAMLRMVAEANLPKEDFSGIVSIRVGSAPIDIETKRRFEITYGIPLLMIYGATEYAGPFAAWSLKDYQRLGASKELSTGRIRNDIARVRIVNPENGVALPTGETGRLEVQLPRVGPDWISTNDLASVDEDDFLTIHGRADDAIIRGGYKIPPDTIADVLRRHPAVFDVAVVGIAHARLGQVPVAAVQLKAQAASVDDAELIAFARSNLIAYQVPVAIRIVPALPRTALGKVFRPGVLALFAG